jgi:hypothetical protein
LVTPDPTPPFPLDGDAQFPTNTEDAACGPSLPGPGQSARHANDASFAFRADCDFFPFRADPFYGF